jgi:hypothetical protein
MIPVNENEREDLVFEMDDDASMADFMGNPREKGATRKRTGEASLPTCPVDMEQCLSMDELLDAAESPQAQTEEPEDDEPVDLPVGILDDAISFDMDDLLIDAVDLENLEGTISEIRLEDALVDLDNGKHGSLAKEEFGKWSDVAVGDQVQVGRGMNDPGPIYSLTLFDHQRTPAPTRQKKVTGSIVDFRPGTRFVIDGSNVCRSYMESNGSFLAPLLTLACTIIEHGGDVICVFDGNERYVLAENRREPNSEYIYDSLLQDQSRRFIEAPSTGPADDYLLKIAHRDRLAVISNDRFNKSSDRHRQQYPWLVPGGSRLIPGGIDFLTVSVPKLKLEAPLEANLQAVLERFRGLVERGS